MKYIRYIFGIIGILSAYCHGSMPFITEDLCVTVPPHHYIIPDVPRVISAIVVHFTNVDRDTTFRIFQGRGYDVNPRPVSAHYVIDRDGLLYRFVEDGHIARHARAANSYSIGIEHIALPGERLTAVQEQTSARLIAALCIRYGIPVENIYGHRWLAGGSFTDPCICPGDLWKTEDELRAWVMRVVVPYIVQMVED